jgi:hypothetical protein
MISPRLQFALRRNQGRLKMPAFLDEAAAALGRPAATVRVLDLAQADALRERIGAALAAIHAGVRPAFHHRWAESEAAPMAALLDGFARRVGDEPVYLFRLLSECCGAIEAGTAEVVAHWPALVSRNQEELLAAVPGADAGIRLELWAEGPGSEERFTFDLLVWGDRWLAARPPTD